MLARRNLAQHQHPLSVDLRVLNRQNGIGAVGQRRPGHDPHGAAGSDLARKGPRRQTGAENRERQWIVGCRAQRILGHEREAVHHRPREIRAR